MSTACAREDLVANRDIGTSGSPVRFRANLPGWKENRSMPELAFIFVPAVLIMGCGKAVARFGLDGEESGGLAQPGGRGGGLAKARVPRSSVQEENRR